MKLFLVLVLALVWLFLPARVSAEQLVIEHGCAELIVAAWLPISDSQNYMDRPRAGRRELNEPDLVQSEGYYETVDNTTGKVLRSKELVARPANGWDGHGQAIRFTLTAAFKRLVPPSDSDPNMPAFLEAAKYLQQEFEKKFSSVPDSVSWEDAGKIYQDAYDNCYDNGKEKLYFDTESMELNNPNK